MKKQKETIEVETEKPKKMALAILIHRINSVKWGSIEAYVQNGRITQITTRRIEKIEYE